jgi:hypothetical protein
VPGAHAATSGCKAATTGATGGRGEVGGAHREGALAKVLVAAARRAAILRRERESARERGSGTRLWGDVGKKIMGRGAGPTDQLRRRRVRARSAHWAGLGRGGGGGWHEGLAGLHGESGFFLLFFFL